jgi:serine/threonine protein kinase
MTPERWAKVKQIFHLALEQPARRRQSVVAEQCGGDHDLRQQVCSLLESHEEAERDSRLESPGHAAAHEPVERIGPYVLEERIGYGGMGEVYRALDTRLQRAVALKILLPEFRGNAEFVQRFHREARAISALDHPNICRLYDIGDHQGRPYLTMELIEGQTLRQRIEQGPIPVAETLHIGMQVASALTEAHSRGFLHRDIKPGNIFVTASGQVKVVDFGLAKCFTGSSDISISLTNSRTIPGTPSYMSPEQALAENLDVRSDIFSLGAVLYEMVTQRPPFRGGSPAHVLDQVLHAAPPLPSALNPRISSDLDQILLRALAKRREDRFGSAAQLQDELSRLLKPVPEALPEVPAPMPKRVRRWWLAAVGAILLAVVTGVLLIPKSGRSSAKHTPSRQVPFDVKPGPKDMPALSPSGDRIVYAAPSGDGQAFDIYVKLLGVGVPLQITHTDAHEMNPVFSPDGQYIAFQRLRDRNPGYFVIPALGGGERRILPSNCDLQHLGGRSIDWSPDGKHLIIADAAKPGGLRSLFRVTFASAEVTVMVADVPYLNHPSYSPDGRWLAYVAGPNGILTTCT